MINKTFKSNLKLVTEEDEGALIQSKLDRARMLSKSNVEDAIRQYEGILADYPENLDALYELTQAEIYSERYEKAYGHIKVALNLSPENGEYWYLIGKCLYKLYHCNAAIIAFNKAEKLSANSMNMQLDKAMAYAILNKFDSALMLVDELLERYPEEVYVLQTCAVIHEMKGNMDLAEKLFRQIFNTYPAEPAILFRLSDMSRLTDEDYKYCNPDHPVFKKRGKFTDIDKSFLYFAKGKEDIRRGKHDDAFFSIAEANSLIRKHHNFDRKNLTIRTNLHIDAFNRELFDQFKGSGCKSEQPIFIVGMPRSGTTLIEQILFSHPDIASAGEVTYMSKIETTLVDVARELGSGYPNCMAEFSEDGLENFGEQYLSHVRECMVGEGKFVTDKMPTNFMNLGLIHLLFPNAKIVHIKRNPLDTCISCYFNRFVDLKSLSFTTDLGDLAFYYNEYLRLMTHWRSVIPESFIDIEYEALIENQEVVVRDVLDYLGLEWSDSCMNFYESNRGILTSSLYQVRKPIYKSSSGRWKNYEKHIGPLIEGLRF